MEIISNPYLSLYNFDSGTTHLQMPFKYALELICDYLAAGQVYQGKDFTFEGEYKWWQNKCARGIAMDEKTKKFVEIMLKTMAKDGNSHILRKEIAKKIWDRC